MATNGTADKERDFGGEHLGSETDQDTALHKIRTAGSISISPELFEKLYLSPRDGSGSGGSIRKAVGNPTPLGIGGFLLSLTPLTNQLMNWRNAQFANGASDIGAYFSFGAILMILAAILEWIVGSTFPMVVFGTFGAFWFTYGATLDGAFTIAQTYAASESPAAANGEATPAFLNAFGFFLLWMGVLCFVFMICSLRTNVAFFTIFITLVFAFSLLTAGFWYMAEGNTSYGTNCIIAGGAFAFVTCVAGWYLFAALLFAAVNFPITLPVGDLSHIIKGPAEKSA